MQRRNRLNIKLKIKVRNLYGGEIQQQKKDKNRIWKWEFPHKFYDKMKNISVVDQDNFTKIQ